MEKVFLPRGLTMSGLHLCCMQTTKVHTRQYHYYSFMRFYNMSQCMRFPTMWYVQPAKPQISLRLSLPVSKYHIVGNHMAGFISKLASEKFQHSS